MLFPGDPGFAGISGSASLYIYPPESNSLKLLDWSKEARLILRAQVRGGEPGSPPAPERPEER